jgi:outer membrane protein assembly factor BamB
VRRAARNLLLSSLVLGLSACGLFGDDDEELEPAELIDFETKVPIKKLWSAKLGDDAEFLRVALRPVGDGNRIYAASFDGKVSAFDPETGKQVWRNKLDITLSSGPGVGDDVVVVVHWVPMMVASAGGHT